ncbi:MAG TPA: hypothetical protein VMG08_04905 [Allosphingosinicella sp.]|nr:hypothetical protein [Allosphingosinicella sp.]
MTEAAPHPTPRGAGAMALSLLAGLFVAIAALTVMLALPLIVVLTAMGGEGRPAGWPVYLWAAFVFAAAFWSVVTGMRVMDDPSWRRIGLLAGIALLAFFSFPPFWYASQ